MKKFFLFVTFFVGYLSLSFANAEIISYVAFSPTAVRVDKGEKDYWFRRCTTYPFQKRITDCAETAWIVNADDFMRLQDTLLSECSKISSHLRSLNNSEECRQKIKKDLEELSNAVSPSTWFFPGDFVTYLGWALENRSELPKD